MLNYIQGDWGWSDTRSQPALQAILEVIPYSMMYGVPSVILSTVIGMGIGLYTATKQYTKTDYAATFVAFFGVSIPNFWFGIILLLVFGVQLGWFPILFDSELAMENTFSLANLRQLTLPIIVLSTSAIAGNMRYARAEALEYVQADFVKTARAKGATGRRILTKHIFRPALVPLSTLLVGDLLGLILTASYLVEVVFGIPGLGRLSLDAITNQDTALVLGTTFIPVFVAVVGNLLQDIAYTVLDPRIDFGDR
jgi:peptide/nickel transport system permease protein